MYGFINVTAVTKIFVPYKTMASQWASKSMQAAQQERQAAEPVLPTTPDFQAVEHPVSNDLAAGPRADEEDGDVSEPTAEALEEDDLSGFDKDGAEDDDEAGSPQDTPQHAAAVVDQPLQSHDHSRQDIVAEESVKSYDPPTEEVRQGHQKDEEDEYAGEDDTLEAGEAVVETHHGREQQFKVLATEKDTETTPSQEASEDNTNTGAGLSKYQPVSCPGT